jgi:modification methylase
MLMETKELDRAIPTLAKDRREMQAIQEEVAKLPTHHKIVHADARDLSAIPDGSVHLVVTSPPYWNLKRYNDGPAQLGHVDDYQEFLASLDRVWKECYRVLTIGGRLVINVGDVMLSRKEFGRHKVVPLHADIQVNCEKIGFDNLAPIIWNKISNATFEVEGNSKFLGKPYEPNGIIKHDIEWILMLRKPGGYRKPDPEMRRLSIIAEQEFSAWYTQIWQMTGASTKKHPAPYPEELAHRLIRMFSFVGDTVLDPFLGSGTTMLAASKVGRNSIGVEVDADYAKMARDRMQTSLDLYRQQHVEVETIGF